MRETKNGIIRRKMQENDENSIETCIRFYLHVSVVCGDADVVKQESEHVHGLGDVREEVSDAPAFLNVVFGVGLQGVHHVRELHPVADEEHGHVVAHQVEVALPGGR